MNKKQILKIGLSILFVGATLTTAGYVMRYNICPKIKVIAYDKEKGSVRIKWGNKEFVLNKQTIAPYISWIAKLENDKVNVYNKKNKLIKTYDTNIIS